MAMPAVPEGYTRYVMKSKFGAGRDFRVLDPTTEADLYLVDGKPGPRPTAEVLDAAGTKLYDVRGAMLSIPKRMDVMDAQGRQLAHLHQKDYAVNDSQGRHVVQITQKWLAVRDRYTVDVADGTDPGLAFALAWAIDRWVERD